MPRHVNEVSEPRLSPAEGRKFRRRHVCCTVPKVQIDKFIQVLAKPAGEGINLCHYRFEEHFQKQLFRKWFIVMERSTKSVCVGLNRTL